MPPAQLNAAQQRLAQNYMGLAGSITRQLTIGKLCVDRDEAFSEACLGLVEAARRFDQSRKVDFSVYAAYWIRAKLLNYIMQASQGQVRYITTEADRRVYFRIGRAFRALGEHANDASVAEYLGVPEEIMTTARSRWASADLSLNAPRWGDPAEAGIDIRDDNLVPADERFVEAEMHGAVLQLVWSTQLDERERQIVRECWLTFEPRSLQSLGTEWGVSREWVRQIEARALRKLRRAADGREASARRRKASTSRQQLARP